MSDKIMTRTLDKIADVIDDMRGVFIKDLEPGTTLCLTVKNGSTMRLFVTDPSKSEGRLFISGSRNLDGEHDGFVAGSTFGGSTIRAGWIGAGMYLEFHKPSDAPLACPELGRTYLDFVIITAPIRSFYIVSSQAGMIIH